MTAAVADASMWIGPHPSEARAAYKRARAAGMSLTRSMVVGNIASHRDCWAFRRKLAESVGCHVRTVQRAISEAVSKGLIGVARCKRGEKPPGVNAELACGWSHRWTNGWGRTGDAVRRCIEAARAKFVVRAAAKAYAPPRPVSTERVPVCSYGPQRGPRPIVVTGSRMTAEEIDRELERITAERRERPPDKPP